MNDLVGASEVDRTTMNTTREEEVSEAGRPQGHVRAHADVNNKQEKRLRKLCADAFRHFCASSLTSIIDQIDIITGEQGSRHNHRTITIHIL